MAYGAVLRNLAVVGEAVKALPDDFKQERPAENRCSQGGALALCPPVMARAKVDSKVGNKKVYDARAWGTTAEAGMASRIVEACENPRSTGTSLDA